MATRRTKQRSGLHAGPRAKPRRKGADNPRGFRGPKPTEAPYEPPPPVVAEGSRKQTSGVRPKSPGVVTPSNKTTGKKMVNPRRTAGPRPTVKPKTVNPKRPVSARSPRSPFVYEYK